MPEILADNSPYSPACRSHHGAIIGAKSITIGPLTRNTNFGFNKGPIVSRPRHAKILPHLDQIIIIIQMPVNNIS
jgi:hypothetical protein